VRFRARNVARSTPAVARSPVGGGAVVGVWADAAVTATNVAKAKQTILFAMGAPH
jgi:hypothetical protein